MYNKYTYDLSKDTGMNMNLNMADCFEEVEPDNISQISRLQFKGEKLLFEGKQIETIELYKKFLDLKWGTSDFPESFT